MTTQQLIKKVCKNWDKYKAKEVKDGGYGSTEVKTLNGTTTSWDNENLLWLMVNIDGGGYEESGNQVGLTKDGKIVWEYQSHCSCDGFADSASTHGDGELCLGCDEKPKSYELSNLPKDWEEIINKNLTEILTICL